jgi:S-DNA-T family DNA segregation ATPase FtsK/SpoIIIE
VGDGLEWLAALLTGLGRFVLPIAIAAIGVALISNRRSSNRLRLVVGCVAAAAAVLGLLHVLRGPHEVSTSYDAVNDAGGWLGAVVGEPLRSLLATAGSSVLLVAIAVAGAILATQASLRTVAHGVAKGARTASARMAVVGKPAIDAARRKFDEVSTLASERVDTDVSPDAPMQPLDPTNPGLPPPHLYDYSLEEPDARPRRRLSPLPPPDPTTRSGPAVEQLTIDLGPGAKSPWKLPPPSCSNAPRPNRSTARPSRNAGATSSWPSRPTAWRRASWA